MVKYFNGLCILYIFLIKNDMYILCELELIFIIYICICWEDL